MRVGFASARRVHAAACCFGYRYLLRRPRPICLITALVRDLQAFAWHFLDGAAPRSARIYSRVHQSFSNPLAEFASASGCAVDGSFSSYPSAANQKPVNQSPSTSVLGRFGAQTAEGVQ